MRTLRRQISLRWLWLALVIGFPVFLGALLAGAEQVGWAGLASSLERGARLYYAPLGLFVPGVPGFVGGLPSTGVGFGIAAAFYALVLLLGNVTLDIARGSARRARRGC